jgi:hypothetical protein
MNMHWRVPITTEPKPIDGAELLWSLCRAIENLPPLFANPLRLAMPASPAQAGEEWDQFHGRMEQRHA